MTLTIDQWHQRFVQQASWTRQLREYLYGQLGLSDCMLILDVGCGTGALSSDFQTKIGSSLFGIDLDFERLSFARNHDRQSRYLTAEAASIPMKSNTFDLVLCHYLMLWLRDPVSVLREMLRVTKPGGHILALAEPDYSSRIDEPAALAGLGKSQIKSLIKQGANPSIGRTLPALFQSAGCSDVQFGCSGFQRHTGNLPEDWELEWEVLEQDLSGSISLPDLSDLKRKDRQAWLDGTRVLWVPTFYAFGTKS